MDQKVQNNDFSVNDLIRFVTTLIHQSFFYGEVED